MPESMRTPQMGAVRASDSKRERAQFEALKRSLNNIDSWELAGASWDEGIVMKFSENFSQGKAELFLRVGA
ncbi:MAG: hypothetical protein V1822_02530 [Candidatus Micrarchaeota archaeon]